MYSYVRYVYRTANVFFLLSRHSGLNAVMYSELPGNVVFTPAASAGDFTGYSRKLPLSGAGGASDRALAAPTV